MSENNGMETLTYKVSVDISDVTNAKNEVGKLAQASQAMREEMAKPIQWNLSAQSLEKTIKAVKNLGDALNKVSNIAGNVNGLGNFTKNLSKANAEAMKLYKTVNGFEEILKRNPSDIGASFGYAIDRMDSMAKKFKKKVVDSFNAGNVEPFMDEYIKRMGKNIDTTNWMPHEKAQHIDEFIKKSASEANKVLKDVRQFFQNNPIVPKVDSKPIEAMVEATKKLNGQLQETADRMKGVANAQGKLSATGKGATQATGSADTSDNEFEQLLKREEKRRWLEKQNSFFNKLIPEYRDFQDALGMKMTKDLGENMRLQYKTVVSHLEKGGVKVDGDIPNFDREMTIKFGNYLRNRLKGIFDALEKTGISFSALKSDEYLNNMLEKAVTELTINGIKYVPGKGRSKDKTPRDELNEFSKEGKRQKKAFENQQTAIILSEALNRKVESETKSVNKALKEAEKQARSIMEGEGTWDSYSEIKDKIERARKLADAIAKISQVTTRQMTEEERAKYNLDEKSQQGTSASASTSAKKPLSKKEMKELEEITKQMEYYDSIDVGKLSEGEIKHYNDLIRRFEELTGIKEKQIEAAKKEAEAEKKTADVVETTEQKKDEAAKKEVETANKATKQIEATEEKKGKAAKKSASEKTEAIKEAAKEEIETAQKTANEIKALQERVKKALNPNATDEELMEGFNAYQTLHTGKGLSEISKNYWSERQRAKEALQERVKKAFNPNAINEEIMDGLKAYQVLHAGEGPSQILTYYADFQDDEKGLEIMENYLRERKQAIRKASAESTPELPQGKSAPAPAPTPTPEPQQGKSVQVLTQKEKEKLSRYRGTNAGELSKEEFAEYLELAGKEAENRPPTLTKEMRESMTDSQKLAHYSKTNAGELSKEEFAEYLELAGKEAKQIPASAPAPELQQGKSAPVNVEEIARQAEAQRERDEEALWDEMHQPKMPQVLWSRPKSLYRGKIDQKQMEGLTGKEAEILGTIRNNRFEMTDEEWQANKEVFGSLFADIKGRKAKNKALYDYLQRRALTKAGMSHVLSSAVRTRTVDDLSPEERAKYDALVAKGEKSAKYDKYSWNKNDEKEAAEQKTKTAQETANAVGAIEEGEKKASKERKSEKTEDTKNAAKEEIKTEKKTADELEAIEEKKARVKAEMAKRRKAAWEAYKEEHKDDDDVKGLSKSDRNKTLHGRFEEEWKQKKDAIRQEVEAELGAAKQIEAVEEEKTNASKKRTSEKKKDTEEAANHEVKTAKDTAKKKKQVDDAVKAEMKANRDAAWKEYQEEHKGEADNKTLWRRFEEEWNKKKDAIQKVTKATQDVTKATNDATKATKAFSKADENIFKATQNASKERVKELFQEYKNLHPDYPETGLALRQRFDKERAEYLKSLVSDGKEAITTTNDVADATVKATKQITAAQNTATKASTQAKQQAKSASKEQAKAADTEAANLRKLNALRKEYHRLGERIGLNIESASHGGTPKRYENYELMRAREAQVIKEMASLNDKRRSQFAPFEQYEADFKARSSKYIDGLAKTYIRVQNEMWDSLESASRNGTPIGFKAFQKLRREGEEARKELLRLSSDIEEKKLLNTPFPEHDVYMEKFDQFSSKRIAKEEAARQKALAKAEAQEISADNRRQSRIKTLYAQYSRIGENLEANLRSAPNGGSPKKAENYERMRLNEERIRKEYAELAKEELPSFFRWNTWQDYKNEFDKNSSTIKANKKKLIQDLKNRYEQIGNEVDQNLRGAPNGGKFFGFKQYDKLHREEEELRQKIAKLTHQKKLDSHFPWGDDYKAYFDEFNSKSSTFADKQKAKNEKAQKRIDDKIANLEKQYDAVIADIKRNLKAAQFGGNYKQPQTYMKLQDKVDKILNEYASLTGETLGVRLPEYEKYMGLFNSMSSKARAERQKQAAKDEAEREAAFKKERKQYEDNFIAYQRLKDKYNTKLHTSGGMSEGEFMKMKTEKERLERYFDEYNARRTSGGGGGYPPNTPPLLPPGGGFPDDTPKRWNMAPSHAEFQREAEANARANAAKVQAEKELEDIIRRQTNLIASGRQLTEERYNTIKAEGEELRKRAKAAGVNVDKMPLPFSDERYNTASKFNLDAVTRHAMSWKGQAIDTYSESIGRLTHAQETLFAAYQRDPHPKYLQMLGQTRAELTRVTDEYKKYQKQINDIGSTFDKFMIRARSHLEWIASGAALSALFVIPSMFTNSLENIEAKMAGIKQVIPMIEGLEDDSRFGTAAEQRKRAREETEHLINLSAKYGVEMNEVMEATRSIARMYGQGENGLANTNLMVSQAARMAVADAFDLTSATRGLESAMSQWKLQTEDTAKLMVNTNRILDVWTKTAHRGAASAQDIADAIQLAGTAAYQGGVSFEFFNALVATAVRATARSGNEIGTSLKSMFVSLRQPKAEKALKKWGIALKEVGEDGVERMRSLEDVILDISMVAGSTGKDINKLMLALSGGKFQYSKVAAILTDYRELIRMLREVSSSDTAGFTSKQIEVQLDTLVRKMVRVKDDLQGLTLNIGGLEAMKEFADSIDRLVLGLSKLSKMYASTAASVAGIGVKFLIYLGIGRQILKQLLITYQAFKLLSVAKAKDEVETQKQISLLATLTGVRKEDIDMMARSRLGRAGLSEELMKGATATKTDAGAINAHTVALDKNTQAQLRNRTSRSSLYRMGGAVGGAVSGATNGAVNSMVVGLGSNADNAANSVKNTASGMGNAAKAASEVAKTTGEASKKVGLLGSAFGTILAGGLRVAGGALNLFKGILAALGGPMGAFILVLSALIPTLIEYAMSVGETEESLRKLADATDEAIAKMEQDKQQYIRQGEIMERLAKSYNRTYDSLSECVEGSEEYNKKQEQMRVVKEAIMGILGKETELIEENGHINLETIRKISEANSEKAKQEQEEMLDRVNASREGTEQMISDTEARIKSLEEEIATVKAAGTTWSWFSKVFAEAHRAIGEGMISLGKTLNVKWLRDKGESVAESAEAMLRGRNGSGDIDFLEKKLAEERARLEQFLEEKKRENGQALTLLEHTTGPQTGENPPTGGIVPEDEEDDKGKGSGRKKSRLPYESDELAAAIHEAAQTSHARDNGLTEPLLRAIALVKTGMNQDQEGGMFGVTEELGKRFQQDITTPIGNAMTAVLAVSKLTSDAGGNLGKALSDFTGGRVQEVYAKSKEQQELYTFDNSDVLSTSDFGSDIIAAARQHLGVPYGGSDYTDGSQFVCTTYVMRVMADAGADKSILDRMTADVSNWPEVAGDAYHAPGSGYAPKPGDIGVVPDQHALVVGEDGTCYYDASGEGKLTARYDISPEEDYAGRIGFIDVAKLFGKPYTGMNSKNSNKRQSVFDFRRSAYEQLMYRIEKSRKDYEDEAKYIELGRQSEGETYELAAREELNETTKLATEQMTLTLLEKMYKGVQKSIENKIKTAPDLQVALGQENAQWADLVPEEKKRLASLYKNDNGTFAKLVDEEIKLYDTLREQKKIVAEQAAKAQKYVRMTLQDAVKYETEILSKRYENLEAKTPKDDSNNLRRVAMNRAKQNMLKGQISAKTLERDHAHDEYIQSVAKDRAEMEELREKIMGGQDNLDNLKKQQEAGKDVTKEIEAQNKALDEAMAKYEDLAMYGSKGTRDLENQFLDADTALEQLKRTLEEVAKEDLQNVRNRAADMFADLIVEGKSFGEVWKSLWQDLARYTINAILKADNTGNIWTSIFGLFGFGGKAKGGQIPSHARGGRIPGYAKGGGIVHGAGTGTSDSILAYLANKDRFVYLSDGEYVMTAEATKRLGVENLDALNGYAEGGAINPIPYIPTLSKGARKRASALTNSNPNARMEQLMQEQTNVIQSMGANGGGQVVVLNTKASSTDVLKAMQENPRAVQAILGQQRRAGFK